MPGVAYQGPIPGSTPGAFDFLTADDWGKVVWADDPSLGYGDGDPMPSWTNHGTISGDATQGTGVNQPTFDAADPAINGHAAATFDGVDVLTFAAFTSVPVYTGVAVFKTLNAASDPSIFGFGTGTGVAVGYTSSTYVVLNSALTQFLNGGTADTDWHIGVLTVTAGTSTLEIDGTTIASGDMSSSPVEVISIGGNAGSGSLEGSIAAMGFKAGLLTDKAGLIADLADYYGITVA